MITGEGKAICDHEMGSPKRGWHACQRPAPHTVKSKHGALWLNYCTDHFDDNSCGRCGNTPSGCTCLKPAENE